MNEKNIIRRCTDTNGNSEFNEDLFLLLVLWTKHTEILYVNFYEHFSNFIYYLDCSEIMGSYIPKTKAPDICGRCLNTFGCVVAGRVRNFCYLCESLDWNYGFYREPWPGRMATILNISEEFLEFHMAYALDFHRKIFRNKLQKQIANGETNVRPVRRFNFAIK